MLDLPNKGEELSLGLHKHIDLVLYDLWTDLYGQKFADMHVAHESTLTPMYRQAWEWALGLSRLERKARFLNLKSTFERTSK